MGKKRITLIVPAYNEEQVLPIFYERVTKVIDSISVYQFEVLFINDGSSDQTTEVIKGMQQRDKRISLVCLSRNFGKEIAIAAGFDHANSDAVIIIDADLQDPPELFNEMIKKWEEGFDDVYAQRISRKGDTWMKKITSRLFYKLLDRLSKMEIQKDTGDFRLLSRRAQEAVKQFRESERYTKGLFSLIGYKKIAIKYSREPRAAGKTKWNYLRLFNLAIEGITSFTTAPLKISTYLGFIFALIAFIYMIIIIVKTILYGEPVQGYPSLISIILFLGGIQLMSLGVIGEYIGRTFKESKNRPLYFIDEYIPETDSKS